MSYTIGIDIGGTFTDCVVVDDGGQVVIGKAFSTPPSFEEGVLDSLTDAAGKLGRTPGELLAVGRVFHGCTVGTNALVEGRTARVGLLVTAGHKEPVFIMTGGDRLSGLPPEVIAALAEHAKPEPLVPRGRVREVHERVTVDGTELVEVDERQVRAAVLELVDEGAEAFAISLLWSIVNEAHEVLVQEIVEDVAPGCFVSRGSEVAPRIGEYERTIGTVVNSLVGPVMKSYLSALRRRLEEEGYRNELGIMSCWGGLIDSGTAERFPLLTIGSGPAAGVVGAQLLSEARTDEPGGGEDVLTTDMGGTTFDVGVVMDGQPVTRATSRYGQYEYAVPTLDVRSLGAGGGSIVHYDPVTGSLRVGPQSAGSRPGPAAFRRGGTLPTVTDSDLVLGYLDAGSLLGGSLRLGLDAARSALASVGGNLGLGAEETAAAAARIVDNQMADGLRLVTVDQGRDPRQFVIYAYGGNGPVHMPSLAQGLGVSRVVVPVGDLASGWSAFGVAAAEAVVLEETGLAMLYPFDPEVLEKTWARLEERALAKMTLQSGSDDDVRLDWMADMKYSTQVNQVRVIAPFKSCDPAAMDTLLGAFEQEYERLYGQGTGYRAAGFALTSLAVRASRRAGGVALRRGVPSDDIEAIQEAARKPDRDVIFYEHGLDRVRTAIYDGARVVTGMTFAGPTIIDFPLTTVVIRPGQTATVDVFGNINIDVKGSLA